MPHSFLDDAFPPNQITLEDVGEGAQPIWLSAGEVLVKLSKLEAMAFSHKVADLWNQRDPALSVTCHLRPGAAPAGPYVVFDCPVLDGKVRLGATFFDEVDRSAAFFYWSTETVGAFTSCLNLLTH